MTFLFRQPLFLPCSVLEEDATCEQVRCGRRRLSLPESSHFTRVSLQISEDFKFCGWLLEEEFVLPCSVLEEDATCEQDRRPAPAQTHHLLPISFLTRERTFFSLFGTEDALTEIVFLKTAFGALALTSLVPLAKGLPP